MSKHTNFIKQNARISGIISVFAILILTLVLLHINGSFHSNSPKAKVGATATDTLTLSPASGTYSVGSTLTVTVNETTTTDAINAVEADLSYNTSQLQFVSAACSSTFSVYVPPTGGSGAVSLACAVPNTTVTGTQTVGTVSFTVLAGGSAPITFASTSAIILASNLSNTWNGNTTGGTYTLANAPTVSITNVSANSEVYGSAFPIDTTATPYSGGTISSVQLLLNGTVVQTLTSAPYNFSLNTLNPYYADGSYTISVKATDNQGNVGTATVAAYISNGDLNLNKSVGVDDLAIMASNWSKTGQTYAQGNITGGTTINISDLSVMAANWGWKEQ